MTAPRIDEIGRLVGDPTRATILDAMMDGRAWTGRELANFAHITPPTASEHLKRLVDGSLVTVVPNGRHRYYRLASPEVAAALESLAVLATRATPGTPVRPKIDAQMKRARTCYDHLAGELGVALADALVRNGAVLVEDGNAELTPAGMSLFRELGIAIHRAGNQRPLCKPCLDWSERRYHLAGRSGTALANYALEQAWVRRKAGTRAVAVTEVGAHALRKYFGIRWEQPK